MFRTIQRLYEKTKNKEVAAKAVKKGYISEEDYFKIVGELFDIENIM